MIHLRKQHENVLDRDVGLMIAVIGIDDIGQGRLIPGDGATYHSVTYRVLVFKPVRGEVVEGTVVELMDFGAFIRMGPLDGLCHVSQICDDYITQAGEPFPQYQADACGKEVQCQATDDLVSLQCDRNKSMDLAYQSSCQHGNQ